MTPDEYAELELRLGATLIKSSGVWWRRVRPFFYRPLVCYEPLDDVGMSRPARWPTCYQYAVNDKARANSLLNFLVYENVRNYSLSELNRTRRKQIERAASQFEVKPLCDIEEIKSQGHKVYLSFYRRTHYKCMSERRTQAGFAKWVDALFAFPKVVVLGAFDQTRLVAISVAYWVNQVLLYATHFADTEAMRSNVASLMLHELRVWASRYDGIKTIILRPYHGGTTHDRFYLERGCSVLRLPARLVAPGVVPLLTRLFCPQTHKLLTGQV